MEAMPAFGWFVLLGCVAQLIDGALGMAYRLEPRRAIGTANAVEFFVSVAIAVTLGLSLGALYWQAVLGLLIGGVVAAPFAAYAARALPQRTLCFW